MLTGLCHSQIPTDVSGVSFSISCLMNNQDLTPNTFRSHFAAIMQQYDNITSKKREIESKIGNIKDVYNDLVKKNPAKNLLFCLDSLYFQYKILKIELEHYSKKIALLQNRAYGDYYKLYEMLVSYLSNNPDIDAGELCPDASKPMMGDTPTHDVSTNSNGNNVCKFPVYNDIDQFYKYKLDDITGIHDYIVNILEKLHAFFYEKKVRTVLRNFHNY